MLEEAIKEFLETYKVNYSSKNYFHHYKELNSKQILKLKSVYNDEKLVLALGAGVSLPFEVPDWNKLLKNLLHNVFKSEDEINNSITELFTSIFEPNPLILGRYLENKYENNLEFMEIVKKSLYKNYNFNESSNTIKEIITFCASPGKSKSLDSIISYNFDDIIEQHLSALSVPLKYKTIYKVGQYVEPDELPIYHVHGFLPFNSPIDKETQITFSENIYHKQYSDIYNWSNIIQINKFSEFNCLFIGISLSDPNLRRLLDISMKIKNVVDKHFIFKLHPKHDDVVSNLKSQFHDNDELLSNENKINELAIKLIDLYEHFFIQDAESLGVQTIWIKNYTEIPDILKQIRSTQKL